MTGSYPSLDLGQLRKDMNMVSAKTTSTWLLKDIARPALVRIRVWIRAYKQQERWVGSGYYAFRSDWLAMRCFVDLQLRLAVEACLWTEGQPWSTLVTGFRPFGAMGQRVIYEGF